jgi:hypothetical protein
MSIFERRSASDSSENRKEVRQALPANAPRPLTASAVRINLKEKKEVDAVSTRRQVDKWQDEAWDYYDYIPEVASSANLVAGILSRINIYGGYVTKSSSAPSDVTNVKDLDPDLVEAIGDVLYLLESGNGGTSGILRDAALNFFIAGECYLVREPARFSNGMQEKYQIRSINEIVALSTSRKSTLAIRPRRDSKEDEFIKLPTDGTGYVARLWRSHPRYGDEADSSMRSLLEICDSLLLLERTINAQAKTQLPAGILFIPDGLSNGYQSDGEMEPEFDEEGNEIAPLSDDESESFEETLQRYLASPLTDDTSGATVGPLIIRGAPDLGDKIKHINLSRPFDPNHNNMAQNKLDRILGGLDIPKDVAAGFASVKYSNAILIEEQLFKAHIEPLILLIVDCLTTSFLRPALIAQGFDPKDVSKAVVWYDPSAITAKPSRAEAATTGYELGAVSLDAWRRANGFADSDAPSELERLQRFGMEKGMLNEATTEMVVNTLIPAEMQEKLRQSQLANSDPNAVESLGDALGTDNDLEPLTPPDTINTQEPPSEAPPTLLEP